MGDGSRGRVVTFPPEQLRAKFKHAAVFGVRVPYSLAGAAAFEEALRRHVGSPKARVVDGTFRGTIPVTMYVERSTRFMVMTHRDGRFISCWRLSEDQLRHVMRRGRL